jgi:hypothetical protein
MHSPCISEDLLRESLSKINEIRAEMDRCMQMQLFAVFMIVVALYDIAWGLRRFLQEQNRAQMWAN